MYIVGGFLGYQWADFHCEFQAESNLGNDISSCFTLGDFRMTFLCEHAVNPGHAWRRRRKILRTEDDVRRKIEEIQREEGEEERGAAGDVEFLPSTTALDANDDGEATGDEGLWAKEEEEEQERPEVTASAEGNGTVENEIGPPRLTPSRRPSSWRARRRGNSVVISRPGKRARLAAVGARMAAASEKHLVEENPLRIPDPRTIWTLLRRRISESFAPPERTPREV